MDYALRSVGLSFGDGHRLHGHSHPWGQLVFASTGTMRVDAGAALWLVPQGRALWVPPGTEHAIEMRGKVGMRTIYVPPGRAGGLPGQCTAVDVEPLLRALILHIVGRGLLRAEAEADVRLAGVFVDRLEQAPRLALHLPLPADKRLRALARALWRSPAEMPMLPALARKAGMSARTLQRLFARETGMRFVEWRQRLRLIHAVTALNSGASVTEAAAEAGYASASAFTAAFRAQMGETPSRFIREGEPR
jgi:AraC-like DNA-binding protein